MRRASGRQDLDPNKFVNKLYVRVLPGEPLPELRLPFSGRVTLVGPGGAVRRGPKAQLCQSRPQPPWVGCASPFRQVKLANHLGMLGLVRASGRTSSDSQACRSLRLFGALRESNSLLGSQSLGHWNQSLSELLGCLAGYVFDRALCPAEVLDFFHHLVDSSVHRERLGTQSGGGELPVLPHAGHRRLAGWITRRNMGAGPTGPGRRKLGILRFSWLRR